MLTWIREKFGTVVIGGIIGLIAFVFVFYGITNPKATRGLHEGAVAGTVNGDEISLQDFQKAYSRRVEFFKSLMGGKEVSEDQLKSFRVKEGVFQELVRRKLESQEAQKQGLVASDDEVRDKIKEIAAFQTNGQFDLATYRQVLLVNNYTEPSFEHLMREDLAVEHLEDYFHSNVHVADSEIKNQFLVNEDKRNIKYVYFTSEAGRREVKVDPAAVQKFLTDPAKLNVVKNQFERLKDTTEFKGKKLDEVKDKIARDLLAGEKVEEVRKANTKLANDALPLLTAGKTGDAKINAMLKDYKVEVKSTGMVTRASPYIPGVGEAPELMKDAFADKSPIDPAAGGKAKMYSSAGGVLVAIISEEQKPELSKLDGQRDTIVKQLESKKQRDAFEAWITKQQKNAKIVGNPDVVGAGSEG